MCMTERGILYKKISDKVLWEMLDPMTDDEKAKFKDWLSKAINVFPDNWTLAQMFSFYAVEILEKEQK